MKSGVSVGGGAKDPGFHPGLRIRRPSRAKAVVAAPRLRPTSIRPRFCSRLSTLLLLLRNVHLAEGLVVPRDDELQLDPGGEPFVLDALRTDAALGADELRLVVDVVVL